jgi:hypothetical protein
LHLGSGFELDRSCDPAFSATRRRNEPNALLCFVHCWHAVVTAAAKVYFICSFRKEECCSMRVHTDRKQPDGAAIAFVVITLLTVTVFAILLSRLNGFV